MAADRDRSPTFYNSDKQQLPQGDNRYRVNLSATFYIAQLDCGTRGCTLNISESAERVLRYDAPRPEVVFETKRYPLQPARDLSSFVDGFARRGCIVYVGGIHVTAARKIAPAPFIFVSPAMLSRFEELHPQR